MNELEDAPGEWLTITQAAHKLGISERQARRYSGRLSGDDRRASGSGPARVRLTAMWALLLEARALATSEGRSAPKPLTTAIEEREMGTEAGASGACPASAAIMSGPSPAGVRLGSGTEPLPEWEQKQLRRDNARLEDENRFMREQLAQAVSGWRDEQRRVKELEQKLKELPAPAAIGPETTPQAQATAPDGTERRAASATGIGAPPRAADSKAEGAWDRLRSWFLNK